MGKGGRQLRLHTNTRGDTEDISWWGNKEDSEEELREES